MKFSALTLVFASACVSGTAAFSAGYLSSLGGSEYASGSVGSSTPEKNYSPTSWTPTGGSPTNGEFDAMAAADPTATSTTLEMTNFLRTEYDAWLAYYGKVADEQRFKIFKDNGIPFQQSEYNSFTGSYMTVWKNFFLEVAPKRADYGRCPNRAAVDMQCAYKVRNANPPFLPYQIYDDLMACLTWEVSFIFC